MDKAGFLVADDMDFLIPSTTSFPSWIGASPDPASRLCFGEAGRRFQGGIHDLALAHRHSL